MRGRTYTIGEITRLGLLLNHNGKPYKDKATVLRIVKTLPHERIKTPFGMGYAVKKRVIADFNKRQ